MKGLKEIVYNSFMYGFVGALSLTLGMLALDQGIPHRSSELLISGGDLCGHALWNYSCKYFCKVSKLYVIRWSHILI